MGRIRSRIKRGECLHCGYSFDTHDMAERTGDKFHGFSDKKKPKVGDVSICLNCGNVMIFTRDGVRAPSDKEKAELGFDGLIERAKKYIKERGYIRSVS